jgi:hypothetical protein
MSRKPKVPEHLTKYRELFDEHMKFVDKEAQILTSGHLIIETALDNVLDLIFFHTEHIRKARLSFSQKMQLARAIALRKNNLQPWTLIASINAVRNEIAHSLASEKRTQKMEQLRRLYFNDASKEFKDKLKDADNEVVAYFACLECVAFLGTLEHDTRALREHIDTLDAVLNPELERVKPPSA